MKILKKIGIVIGLTIGVGYGLGLLVVFTSSLFTEKDSVGNDYEAVIYGFMAMPIGAIIGLLLGLHIVRKPKK